MDPLLNPSSVRGRMVLGDKPGYDPLIFSAIEAAQLHIASVLETDLQKKVGIVDRFFLDQSLHSGIQRQGMYRLRLTRGFLLGTPVVEVSNDWNNSDGSLAAIDPTLMTWGTDGLEKGVLSIDGPTHHGRWVKVTYDAGFENPIIPLVPAYNTYGITGVTPIDTGVGYTDGAYPLTVTTTTGTGFDGLVVVAAGQYSSIVVNAPGTGYLNTDTFILPAMGPGANMEINPVFGNLVVVPAVPAYRDYAAVGAPDWLLEGILAYVPVVFNFGPKTKRDPEAEKGYQVSGDHAMSIIAPKARKRVLMLNPL